MTAARFLPWALELTHGSRSVRLFPAGRVDTLRWLEREGVPDDHELEFVTRAEPQQFAPYAVLRLHEEHELPALERVRARLGGAALPSPRTSLIQAWPERPLPGEQGLRRGRVALAGPPEARELLRRLRDELSAPERIAWLEAAWPPEEGRPLTHRYYLDLDATPWLVRDRGREGKTLHEGEVSPDAERRFAVPLAGRPP